MSDQQSELPEVSPEMPDEGQARREFLRNSGKWSTAAAAAAIGGAAWLSTSGISHGGSWVNRRHGGGWVNGRGGGWVNGSGGGGTWVNRGSGSWVNRRGGGGWVNRR